MPFGLSLSRRRLAQIAVIIVMVGNAALFTLNSSDQQLLASRQDSLANLERAIRNPVGISSPDVLKQQLDEASAKVVVAGAAFPARVDPLAVQDHIIRAAQQAEVQVTGLSLEPATTRVLAAGKYPVLIATVTADGEVATLDRYVANLERTVYTSTVLENVSLSQAQGKWTLKLNVVIYGSVV